MNISEFKKILIIRLSSLGDVLLSTPFVRSIKNTYPDLEIHFLTKSNYADILRHNHYISKIFIFEKKQISNSLVSELSDERYDLIIDLQNNPRSSLLRKKLKVTSVKFCKRNLDKFLLVKFKINRMTQAPQIPVRYAETLPEITLDSDGLDLFTDKKISFDFQEAKKYIGLCPGAKHYTKRWPKEYFIKLGNILNKSGFDILVFGGKDDKQLCIDIAGQIENAIDLSNDDNILQTASDMKICSAVICNDSGLMHAACAVKIPVLTLFGSSVKEFGFTPYKNTSIILENNSLDCRPCSHIGRESCPLGHFNCMNELTPDYVFNELLILIGK